MFFKMEQFMYKIFVKMSILCFTLDYIFATDLNDTQMDCVRDIAKYFKLIEGEINDDQLDLQLLTAENCVKNGIMYLNENDDRSNFVDEYFLAIWFNLDSENIQNKSEFCKGKCSSIITRCFGVSGLKCSRQLKNFPDSSKSALEYVFLNDVINDFSEKFEIDYVQHIIKEAKVKVDVKDPVEFCKNKDAVSQPTESPLIEEKNKSITITNDKDYAINAINKRKLSELNDYSDKFYRTFRNKLDSSDIQGKNEFCKNNYNTEESVLCLKQLSLFPESPHYALIYAFYNVNFKDFEGKEMAKDYMKHMTINVKIKDSERRDNTNGFRKFI